MDYKCNSVKQGSLPHRQLRNYKMHIYKVAVSSLPHRQLRKNNHRDKSNTIKFTAAQAA